MKQRSVQVERGAAAVEFAIVLVAFVMLLTGIVGFGHWMYTLEMLADATRVGARIAVVCGINDPDIKNAIQSRVPQLGLTPSQISVQYFPDGCGKANCERVQVSVIGATYAPMIPFLPTSFAVPAFSTSLQRESLDNSANPVCS